LGSFIWDCGVRRRSWGGCWDKIFNRKGREGRKENHTRQESFFAFFEEVFAIFEESFEFFGAYMATLGLIEYKDASPEVRAVYDDIMATRKTDWINNFWKAIAHDPATLKRTWEDIKQVMGPGALDPLTKELVYLAVSVSNQCGYCIASHTAGARNKGMSDAMFKELMAVVGMANETNRLVAGYQVAIDDKFKV
jgi:AhpD family alkylhydroperoxidase